MNCSFSTGLFENIGEKTRKCWQPAFYLFPTMFSNTLSKTYLNCSVTFILSSVIAFNLDRSVICSFSKGISWILHKMNCINPQFCDNVLGMAHQRDTILLSESMANVVLLVAMYKTQFIFYHFIWICILLLLRGNARYIHDDPEYMIPHVLWSFLLKLRMLLYMHVGIKCTSNLLIL